MKYQSKILIFLIFLSTVSCINLKTLSSYSENSVEAIKKYDEIGFSFKKICEKNCEFKINSDEKAIATRLGKGYKPIKEISDCECDIFEKADSSFNKIYFASYQYLEGLKKLSSDEILTFKYDTLSKALKETEILDIKDKEIDAFNKLINVTTKFIVDTKRRKELKSIIEDANQPFQILIDNLKFAIDNPLKLSLETEISLEYNYYKALVINQKELSLKEKIEIETSFIEKRSKILEKIKLLSEYSKILDEIKNGHQSLYENRDIIHKKEIANLIASYITNVKELKTEFDNINTEE
jgi:hypothetical protein